MTADLRREKLNLQRSQNNVFEWLLLLLRTSLLNTTIAVDPNPPGVEKTNGQKEPNSASKNCSSAQVMGHCVKWNKKD